MSGVETLCANAHYRAFLWTTIDNSFHNWFQAHLTDKAYLEQAIEDLRHELDPVSKERDDLLQRVAESRSMIHDLEHQVSAWAEKMKVADSDIEDYQYQVNQLRFGIFLNYSQDLVWF